MTRPAAEPASAVSDSTEPDSTEPGLGDKESRILDAVLVVLGRDGISGVSMRAVAREAGVALGLASYYFDDKTSLIAAALRRLGDQDAEIVAPTPGLEPVEQLRTALRRVADDEFLRLDYLGLRLQLWALAPVEPTFADINRRAQLRYRDGLARLIDAAVPGLDRAEVEGRAAEILTIQNGIWLTSIVIADRDTIERGIARCERIALAP